MTDQPPQDSTIDSLSDPEALRGREDVPFDSVERVLDSEPFESLRDRYEKIDGVVQIGLTTADGRLLLQGFDGASNWAPPGGEVDPGQDWVEAARTSMERLTGVAIEIDDAAFVEHLTFRLTDDEERGFTSYGVSFTASLVDDDSEFDRNPTLAIDPPEEYDWTLAWFDSVPEDANPNHVEHIEQFLETATSD
jgi:ADP-ribose pyrophosphatase YjhB (NUDIX family)